MPDRAQQLAHLSDAEKLAVFTWYRGCREELLEHFPLVVTLAEGKSSGTSGWGQVLRDLSGGAFGPLDDTARQPVRTILAKIEDDARRAQELERRSRENAAGN